MASTVALAEGERSPSPIGVAEPQESEFSAPAENVSVTEIEAQMAKERLIQGKLIELMQERQRTADLQRQCAEMLAQGSNYAQDLTFRATEKYGKSSRTSSSDAASVSGDSGSIGHTGQGKQGESGAAGDVVSAVFRPVSVAAGGGKHGNNGKDPTGTAKSLPNVARYAASSLRPLMLGGKPAGQAQPASRDDQRGESDDSDAESEERSCPDLASDSGLSDAEETQFQDDREEGDAHGAEARAQAGAEASSRTAPAKLGEKHLSSATDSDRQRSVQQRRTGGPRNHAQKVEGLKRATVVAILDDQQFKNQQIHLVRGRRNGGWSGAENLRWQLPCAAHQERETFIEAAESVLHKETSFSQKDGEQPKVVGTYRLSFEESQSEWIFTMVAYDIKQLKEQKYGGRDRAYESVWMKLRDFTEAVRAGDPSYRVSNLSIETLDKLLLSSTRPQKGAAAMHSREQGPNRGIVKAVQILAHKANGEVLMVQGHQPGRTSGADNLKLCLPTCVSQPDEITVRTVERLLEKETEFELKSGTDRVDVRGCFYRTFDGVTYETVVVVIPYSDLRRQEVESRREYSALWHASTSLPQNIRAKDARYRHRTMDFQTLDDFLHSQAPKVMSGMQRADALDVEALNPEFRDVGSFFNKLVPHFAKALHAKRIYEYTGPKAGMDGERISPFEVCKSIMLFTIWSKDKADKNEIFEGGLVQSLSPELRVALEMASARDHHYQEWKRASPRDAVEALAKAPDKLVQHLLEAACVSKSSDTLSKEMERFYEDPHCKNWALQVSDAVTATELARAKMGFRNYAEICFRVYHMVNSQQDNEQFKVQANERDAPKAGGRKEHTLAGVILAYFSKYPRIQDDVRARVSAFTIKANDDLVTLTALIDGILAEQYEVQTRMEKIGRDWSVAKTDGKANSLRDYAKHASPESTTTLWLTPSAIHAAGAAQIASKNKATATAKKPASNAELNAMEANEQEWAEYYGRPSDEDLANAYVSEIGDDGDRELAHHLITELMAMDHGPRHPQQGQARYPPYNQGHNVPRSGNFSAPFAGTLMQRDGKRPPTQEDLERTRALPCYQMVRYGDCRNGANCKWGHAEELIRKAQSAEVFRGMSQLSKGDQRRVAADLKETAPDDAVELRRVQQTADIFANVLREALRGLIPAPAAGGAAGVAPVPAMPVYGQHMTAAGAAAAAKDGT